MTNIEKYYNKFNEDHRLTTRHGIVEMSCTMHHIKNAIAGRSGLEIADIGCGTGRYSIELCHMGHNLTAVELVKRNIEVLRSKHEKIKTWQGNALDLHFLDEKRFDITLCFGPMYHLHTEEERLCVMEELKRITKTGGLIFIAYIMNENAIIRYCFGENKINECIKNGWLTSDFHTITQPEDLYSYVRLDDINAIQKKSGLERVNIFNQEGAADYMRRELNAMDEESFSHFVEYTISISQRPELLGAGTHIVDVLKNN
ncbi:MAG: class I SAM-dependent methyltransferase [Treponema sp.]|nr:class I SAM-dependent methyltransferase [Treponema sp.]